jgi:ABC-type nitrate/sulfonate/bicarbonate transport system permease component
MINSSSRNKIYLLLVFLGLIAFWQFGESYLSSQMLGSGRASLEAFIPTPQTIVKTFVLEGGLIFSELSVTCLRASAGLIIGILFALLIVFLIYYFPFFRSVVIPISFAVNSFPIIGFSPIIILLFGQGSAWAIIFVSALISYFPTLVSLEAASRDIKSQTVMELMRVLNATRFQIIKKIILPNSVPYFFVSLKLAIPASIMGAVIGEWLGANNGIGRLMILSFYQMKPGLLYASLLSVVVVSCLIIALLSLLEKKYCFLKKM